MTRTREGPVGGFLTNSMQNGEKKTANFEFLESHFYCDLRVKGSFCTSIFKLRLWKRFV